MIINKFFLALVVVFSIYAQGHSQDIKRLCICFDASNENLTVVFSEDSASTTFKVFRESFESKVQRNMALEDHKQNVFEPYPHFYFSFFSTQKPVVLDSLDDICMHNVEMDTFRKDDYQKPPGNHTSLYTLLKKLPDGKYLKWEAVLEPIE